MKKIMIALLSLVVMFSFASCAVEQTVEPTPADLELVERGLNGMLDAMEDKARWNADINETAMVAEATLKADYYCEISNVTILKGAYFTESKDYGKMSFKFVDKENNKKHSLEYTVTGIENEIPSVKVKLDKKVLLLPDMPL